MSSIFNDDFIKKLPMIKLTAGSAGQNNAVGTRKSRAKGSGTEFSDFREYMPGDDIRRLDWNAYGRFEKLYLKQYMDEKEITFTVFADMSGSMWIEHNEEGQATKVVMALRLAALVAYLALRGQDRVRIVLFGGSQARSEVFHGGAAFKKVLLWLEQQYESYENDMTTKQGADNPEKSLPHAVNPERFVHGKGVTYIISDMYPEGDEKLFDFRKLRYFLKQDIRVFQILSESELKPAYEGTSRLIDIENGNGNRVTLSAQVLKSYEKELKKFTAGIEADASSVGGSYILACASDDINEVIYKGMNRSWT